MAEVIFSEIMILHKNLLITIQVKVKKKENTESVTTDKIVGVYKDIDGNEIESNEIIIVTSKTGAHVYPGFPKKKGNK